MGISITRNNQGILLSVQKHMDKLLDNLSLKHHTPFKTPMSPQLDMTSRKDTEPPLSPTDKSLYIYRQQEGHKNLV